MRKHKELESLFQKHGYTDSNRNKRWRGLKIALRGGERSIQNVQSLSERSFFPVTRRLSSRSRTAALYVVSAREKERSVRSKEPRLARPTPEAMAIDVYTTVRWVGYPIEVLSDYS